MDSDIAMPSADVTWLLQRLNTQARCPRAWKEAWQLAKEQPDDSTASIFLNHNTFAWLAYHLTKSAALQPTHFAGQAVMREQLNELENESEQVKLSIAKALVAAASEETKKKAGRWLDRPQIEQQGAHCEDSRANKRQRVQGQQLHYQPTNAF